MDVSLRFTDEVRLRMTEAIAEASGNEVFFGGTIDSQGKIVSVIVAARGNQDSVPIQLEVAYESHVLIHNHPSGILQPSNADISIAAQAGQRCQGFYIINNDVSDCYVVVEPIKPKSKQKLNLNDVASYISTGGPLDTGDNYFEERPAQIELLKKISTAFNDDGVGVFEAGTGVGKSYAYLIPSILWAATNNERVVISTGTINLQQQLAEKDVPAALKITGKKLKFILMKGRQNYICLRRFNDLLAEPDLFDNENQELDLLSDWIKTTETGSRSDLSFLPSEYLWSRICSESDACMGMKCKYHSQCFVMKVRKEAADAQILIVNHHLLFADIEARLSGIGFSDTAVLPPYRRLVFDEAHGIENAATSFFSETLTRFKVNRQLNILYRKRRGGAMAGHLYTLEVLASGENWVGQVLTAIESVQLCLDNLDAAGLDTMSNQYALRLTPTTEGIYTLVLERFEKLGIALTECTTVFREMIDSIDEDLRDSPAVWETKTVLSRLDVMAQFCKAYVQWQEYSQMVFFVERVKMPPLRGGGDQVQWFCRFVQAPLNIASRMNEGVFEPLSTVVCTSATIRSSKNFNYWLGRSGACFVEDDRLATGEFPSPFPYHTNVLLSIPTDAPLPDSSSFQPYVERAVARLISAAGGRTLVLFTSYDSLRNCWEACRRTFVNSGIALLKQGDEDRFRLLEKFKDDETSVLFATDSFWEGVDVPGSSLSQVVIVKLPFRVPDDPIFAARSEAVEQRGVSSFMELSVPEAVIKFRQGVGRLMRRSTDRGAVVVLDRRLVEKRYGRVFLEGIPRCRRIHGNIDELCKTIEHFIS
jgi:ATP-dependent DNA helicase DinG